MQIQKQARIEKMDEFCKNIDLIFSTTTSSIDPMGIGSLELAVLPVIIVAYDKKSSPYVWRG